jgi:hypothetical protein
VDDNMAVTEQHSTSDQQVCLLKIAALLLTTLLILRVTHCVSAISKYIVTFQFTSRFLPLKQRFYVSGLKTVHGKID